MAIIYVNSDATGLNNGTSWTDAYTNLRTAVENAVNLDEVWFTLNTSIPPNLFDGITTNILVHGGFAGTEISALDRNPSTYIRTARYVLRMLNPE